MVVKKFDVWSKSRSRMASQFVGYAVSATCRNDLGSYQGQICNVDPKEHTITLKKAFKNGIPCQVPQVTLR
jgi:enhancer of mRNA-decapping protein 3